MAKKRQSALPTYGVLLLAAGLALNLGMVLATVTTGVHPDFVGLHAAAREFDSGLPLYSATTEGSPNLNPPQVAIAMWPLASLSVNHAIVVWWMFCAACAWLCVSLWGRVLPAPYPLIVLGAILVTPSGYGALRFGAWTWPLTAILSCAWVAARSGQRARAGALLGLLASWRLFALLFVPYLLWKRQWRTLALFSAAFTAVWVVGLAVCGRQTYVDWISMLGSIDWHSDYYNASLLGFSRRLFGDSLDHPEWVMPMWLLLSGATAAVTWWRLRVAHDLDTEWACIALLSLLLSPLGWTYYLALAAGPVAAVSLRQRSPAALFATAFFILPWVVAQQIVTPNNIAFLLSLHLWGALFLLAICLRAASCEVHTESQARRGATARA